MTIAPIDPSDPVRLDLLRRTPQGRRLVLEISASSSVGTAYSLYSPSSRLIRLQCRLVDPDELSMIDAQRAGEDFDAIILDDVLSETSDVQGVLGTLAKRSSDGAVLTASIRNTSHWSITTARLRGEAVEAPRINKARLIEMLTAAGWTLVDASPIPSKAHEHRQDLDALLAAAGRLAVPLDVANVELTAEAWVVRAVRGTAKAPVTIAALGMKKVAGVTDARIDHPMKALASLPFVRAAWGAGGVEIPGTWAPGVLILHRQFMDKPGFVQAMESRIARGWIIVSEIDDDPHHWPQFVNSNFRAFRGVHAVTVTNEPLAQMVRQWNPHVEILPNAASYIPPSPPGSPKAVGKVRVFFGALNRQKDWADVVRALGEAALRFAGRVEFVVVHDRAFFDALPSTVEKSLHDTLAIDDYLALLATCDVSLLPLNDTPFNRLKSDLKLVESCAAGVVPICSETVYGAEPVHRGIALFAHGPAEWADALTMLVTDAEALSQRRALGEAHVRARRMQADQAAHREALFRAMMADRASLEADRQARLRQYFQ